MNANALAGDQLLAALSGTADIYPQKIDVIANTALLIELDAAAYRAASFLDDRILSPKTRGAWTAIPRLVASAARTANSRPLHFIFHSGHVGSTLISRLLDEIAGVLSLREPLPLRTLAELHDALDRVDALLDSASFAKLLQAFLHLWSRGYPTTHSVILKATSSTTRLAPPMLSLATTANALCINVRAETYLATLLAGQNSLIDLRGHGPNRVRRLHARLAAPTQPLYSLSLGELAAMSWLVESWTQYELAQTFRSRILQLDFDVFLTDIAAGMRSIAGHFALPVDERYFSNVAASQILSRYSKATDYEYSPQIRKQLLDEARTRHADELRKGMRWLEATAQTNSTAASLFANG